MVVRNPELLTALLGRTSPARFTRQGRPLRPARLRSGSTRNPSHLGMAAQVALSSMKAAPSVRGVLQVRSLFATPQGKAYPATSAEPLLVARAQTCQVSRPVVRHTLPAASQDGSLKRQ
jgi:hypothetical protein